MEIIPLLPECPWSSFLPPTIKYCEDNLCSYITQPSNTWSNLAFIIVGIYLIILNQKDKIKYLRNVGLIAIVTGIASFLYHASFTFLFQFFDLSSMYLFSTMILSINMRRMNFITANNQNLTQLVILFTSMGLLYIFKPFGIPIFALQVFIGFGLEFYLFKKSNKIFSYFYYKLTIVTLFIAFTAWILDFKRIVCNPMNHLLQGHAIWHIFSSLCFLFLYKFYSQNNFQNSLEKNT
jgi:hypothetical protein